jgi:UDP-GlcNAc:undecaprenyl-phosphate GlcNAc-1-phosphate transferase
MGLTGIIISVGLGLGVSAALLPVVIRLGHRYGLLDMPGRHKRHKEPTPALGGLALFAAVWIGIGGLVLLYPSLWADFRGALGYIFAGAMIITLVGFSDDLTPLSAPTKLVAQIATGLVLYIGGLTIDPLTLPFYGAISPGNWSVLITVLWVVMLTNAINILDGLDGLAGGVSLIASIVLAVIGNLYGIGSVLALASVQTGFLVVFLYYNRFPARVFLGDSGALQIGYYFAVMSLLVPIRSYTAAALYVPLLTLAVPLLEAGMSFVRRLVAGRSVMQADRRHIFHLLAMAGLSPRRIVLVFYALSTVFGLFALGMFYLNRLWVLGFLVLFMVVIFILFLILLTNLSRLHKHGLAQSRNSGGRPSDRA